MRTTLTVLRWGASGIGGAVARDPGGLARRAAPVLVGVLVLRAAFGQDAPHAAPWFDGEAAGIERVAAAPATPDADPSPGLADPVVFGLQSELADLGFYTGAIDGVAGSRTRAAIEAFERAGGLPVTGRPGAELLARIRAGASDLRVPVTRTARLDDAPVPLPLPSPSARAMRERTALLRAPDPIATGSVEVSPTVDARDAVVVPDTDDEADDPVMLAQRGLAAWGADVAVDGLMGPMTRAAIEAYEGANGLPVTGAAEAVLAHMRAGGLL